jgi:hypothetical protein
MNNSELRGPLYGPPRLGFWAVVAMVVVCNGAGWSAVLGGDASVPEGDMVWVWLFFAGMGLGVLLLGLTLFQWPALRFWEGVLGVALGLLAVGLPVPLHFFQSLAW